MSFMDGVFASLMLGFTANYITPFALLLKAKVFQIGLLSSIPQLIGSVLQLKSAEIIEMMKSRVRTITLFVLLQALTWFAVLLLIFSPEKIRVELFILLIIINTALNSLSATSWASLMGDTVDKYKYGEYFSWRGRIMGFVTLLSGFAAGLFLYLAEDKLLAFLIIFGLAGLCRVISGLYIGRMEDIPVKTEKSKEFGYLEFISRIRESNFARFVMYVSLMNFAVNLASPFFAVYMLEELKFKYSTYTIIITAGALAGLLLLTFWGNFSDRFGNVKIIRTTSRLVIIFPLLWLLTKNPIHLVLINAFAGYIWAGFNLTAVNFIYDSASTECRTRCIAYFNFTNGVFIFMGAFLGGWLATHIPRIVLNSNIATLFLISGIARFLVVAFFINSFHEVRPVSEIKDGELLYIALGIKPMSSVND